MLQLFIDSNETSALESIIYAIIRDAGVYPPMPMNIYFNDLEFLLQSCLSISYIPENTMIAQPLSGEANTEIKYLDNSKEKKFTLTEKTTPDAARLAYDQCMSTWESFQDKYIYNGIQNAARFLKNSDKTTLSTTPDEFTLYFKPLSLLCIEFPEEFINQFILYVCHFNAGAKHDENNESAQITHDDLSYILNYLQFNKDEGFLKKIDNTKTHKLISNDIYQKTKESAESSYLRTTGAKLKYIVMNNSVILDNNLELLQKKLAEHRKKIILFTIVNNVCISMLNIEPHVKDVPLHNVIQKMIGLPFRTEGVKALADIFHQHLCYILVKVFTEPSSAITMMRFVYQFIDWYLLMLNFVLENAELDPYLQHEQRFWQSASGILMQVNKHVPETKIRWPAWQAKVIAFANEVSGHQISISNKKDKHFQKLYTDEIKRLLNPKEIQLGKIGEPLNMAINNLDYKMSSPNNPKFPLETNAYFKTLVEGLQVIESKVILEGNRLSL